MQQLTSYLLPLCVIAIVVVLIFLLIKIYKLTKHQAILHSQLSGNDLLVTELREQMDALRLIQQEHIAKWQAWQVEQEQVSGQLDHRTKLFNENLKTLKQEIEQLYSQQPEDKLYSRAQKMVKLGAGVDEIVAECQLPRVEAEMLITMYQKQSSVKK